MSVLQRVVKALIGLFLALLTVGASYGTAMQPEDLFPGIVEEPFQPEPPDVGLDAADAPTDTHAGEAFIQFTAPIDDAEVVQGTSTTLCWRARGPIQKVRLYYYYDRCPLGGRSRGSFGRVIFGQMIPNFGEVDWNVPWMDTAGFRLRIAAYDGAGEMMAEDEIGLRYRPAELADLPQPAIGIIRKRQRLYYYAGGRVQRMHIVSTAAPGYTTPRMHPGSYDRRRGAMGKVFRKARAPRSRMYNCVMPYWLQITSSGSHGIHATSPGFYRYLGRPASHGCVRQHGADARVLYSMVNVGTPVYVF